MRRRRIGAAAAERPRSRAIPAALLLVAMGGCHGAPPEGRAAPDGARAIVDDTGASVLVPNRPMRVACLSPDLTEIAFAVGAGASVIAACDACDAPAEAALLPRLGPMIAPSAEALLLLEPDLILATSEGNPLAAVARLRDLGLPVVGLRGAAGLEGVAAQIRRVGDLLGRAAEAAILADEMLARVATVREGTRGRARIRACVLVWTDPLIAAGTDTYLTELADAAGADNACAAAPGWPRISREAFLLAAPEVLLLATGQDAALLGDWAAAVPAMRRPGGTIVLPARPFLRPTAELGRAAEMLSALLVDARALPPAGP